MKVSKLIIGWSLIPMMISILDALTTIFYMKYFSRLSLLTPFTCHHPRSHPPTHGHSQRLSVAPPTLLRRSLLPVSLPPSLHRQFPYIRPCPFIVVRCSFRSPI